MVECECLWSRTCVGDVVTFMRLSSVFATIFSSDSLELKTCLDSTFRKNVFSRSGLETWRDNTLAMSLCVWESTSTSWRSISHVWNNELGQAGLETTRKSSASTRGKHKKQNTMASNEAVLVEKAVSKLYYLLYMNTGISTILNEQFQLVQFHLNPSNFMKKTVLLDLI